MIGVRPVTSGFFQFLLGHILYDKKAERKGGEGRDNGLACLRVCHYWPNLRIHMPDLVEMQIFQEQ